MAVEEGVLTSITPSQLREIGQALYGACWQRALARALGPLHPSGWRASIDASLVRKWARGTRPVPDWAATAMARLLDDAARKMRATADCARVAQFRRADDCARLAESIRG
jgi:hypothetical protein